MDIFYYLALEKKEKKEKMQAVIFPMLQRGDKIG